MAWHSFGQTKDVIPRHNWFHVPCANNPVQLDTMGRGLEDLPQQFKKTALSEITQEGQRITGRIPAINTRPIRIQPIRLEELPDR